MGDNRLQVNGNSDRRERKRFFKAEYLLPFILGLCIGGALLWGISVRRDHTDTVAPESIESMESEGSEISEPVYAETVVDYPFFSSEEGWSLVLRESGGEDAKDGEFADRKFCLYDENGKILQTFSCDIAAEELVFRFDRLSHDYGYDADLIVFPAGAPETGTEGLCYSWDDERRKFIEAPIRIPWYQEDCVKDQAFMTVRAEENEDTNVICRINEGSREVVELRRWTLCKGEETGEESLCIYDCLEGQDIYSGKVKRYETGDLVNEKYYQYLFWNGLKDFWSPEKNERIRVQKVVQGKGLVNAEYRDKKDFLADYGFAQTEPFYEYYDQFHNLIMELYFNPQTGQGCGICFYYYFNYELEKVASCEGFVLDETRTAFWKPQDIFSRLSVSGEDLREYHIPGYREIYEYTDDGRLSFFEARGIDECEHESVEVSLLSMDYIYRSDGTLCHKEYRHYPMLFGTTCQWQCSDYDEQERPVYCYAYITHGTLEYFYIYEDDGLDPAYCLEFDHGGSPPVMVAYDRGN